MNLFVRFGIKRRIVVFSILSIVLVLMLLIGNTYSIFVSSNIDDTVNVYKTGNLDITYTLSEDNVKFLDITPISIEESIKIKPYRVTVNNAGTVPYMFDLILQDTTSTESISSEYIMVQVGKMEPIKLASTTNNIIKEDIIVPAGESVIVDVRVWLSDEVKNTEIGKSFYAKLVLDGLAVYADSSDIDNSVLQANRLLSEMPMGSYVLYTGNNGCVGDSCSGVNANSSESSNGYCEDPNYQYNSSGWRIAYNSDGSSHIVSTGSPECMCTNNDGTTSNSDCGDYILSGSNLYIHYDNMNNIALKYCNQNYSKLGVCNSTTAWSMNGIDFNIITNNDLLSCKDNSSVSCGLGNDLIENGGHYWYTEATNSLVTYYTLFWYQTNKYVTDSNSSNSLGVRPVIKLDTTVVVTGGTGTEDDPYTIENVVPNSLKAFNSDTDTSYFHNEAYRTTIKNISFVDYIDISGAVTSWDMSRSNNESIIAWVTNNATSGYYDLYIGSEEPIKGINLNYYFSSMTNVDSIDFSNLDTSLTTSMRGLFHKTGYDSTIFTLDLGDNFDTSNVENMRYMFGYVGFNNSNFTLDLGDKFDTSNVTNMDFMFYNAGNNSLKLFLNLEEKFDTSKVINMERMFFGAGFNSLIFTLDLGEKFDTSNVVYMNYMFKGAGYSSEVFELDLGEKFDTSKVTNMDHMFENTGYNSTVFTLDLGDKFDTSNVTNMSHMFSGVGYSSPIMMLDLGDKFNTSKVIDMFALFNYLGQSNTSFTLDLGEKFDTSNVEDMSYMFQHTGLNSTVFTLDLGDKFDTSKVKIMKYMFNGTGYRSPVMTLDLGEKFNTLKVTNMEYMFQNLGAANSGFILNLASKFDTSNVENMNHMFAYTGAANSSISLDLSMFNFDKVTNYTDMFLGFKTTGKIYVKNTSDQSWIVGKGFSNVTSSNVLVK